jgi:acetyl esterase/lipase
MRLSTIVAFLSLGAILVLAPIVRSADSDDMTRTEDVIYGRKDGMALTMDVFAPRKEANGAAVIWVVSGGWFSSHDSINAGMCSILVKRGYTVFAVVHGSQPRFTIQDAVGDINRGTRFIRANAERFKIDPDRIGITGGSAGGHLSLMQGTAGDAGNKDAKDPVDKVSSRVQAVACFFPPTDFLNWGEDGTEVTQTDLIKKLKLRSPFEFQEFDRDAGVYQRVDDKKAHELLKKLSPITHVSKENAPMMIVHGDSDRIVPIQQAKSFADKCKTDGATCELVVKVGADHGWEDMGKDIEKFADWFDKQLKK